MKRVVYHRFLPVLLGAVLMLMPGFAGLQRVAAQAAPTIKLVSPANGQSVSGPLDVRVQITGLKLDGTKIGTPPQAGVGHWHVYVDDKYAGLSVSDVVTIPNDALPEIAAGQHEIKVQLHNNDHTPIQPDVTNAITVSFTAGQAGAASQPAAAQAPAQSGQQQASALPPTGTGGLVGRHAGWSRWSLLLVGAGTVLLACAGWL